MKTITLFFLISIPTMAMSTVFRTLEDGEWSNNTDVWSTDGENPCGCSPSANLSGDTVFIDHEIELDVNLSVEDLSLLEISDEASLDGYAKPVNLKNGKIIANGNLSCKRITIDSVSLLMINEAIMVVKSQLDIYGILTLNTAAINYETGGIHIYENGILNLAHHSKLYCETSNLKNFGLINMSENSCIELNNGSIRNESSGAFFGEGSVIMNTGNIINYNSWDLGIVYCTKGNDIGMPVPTNCNNASDICSAVIISGIDLYAITATPEMGYNDIDWTTAMEFNSVNFELERSVDGINWAVIDRQDGIGYSASAINYSFRDYVAATGSNYYYRLISVGPNNSKTASKIISVRSESTTNVVVYPNPANDYITLSSKENLIETITVYNINGTVVTEKKYESRMAKVKLDLSLMPGVYFVSVNGVLASKNIKLTIK